MTIIPAAWRVPGNRLPVHSKSSIAVPSELALGLILSVVVGVWIVDTFIGWP